MQAQHDADRSEMAHTGEYFFYAPVAVASLTKYVWGAPPGSLVKKGIPEVREVSRKLPGARGFAVIEYGPVASHGDPIQPRNYGFV